MTIRDRSPDRDASCVGAGGDRITLTFNGEPVDLVDGVTLAEFITDRTPSVRGVAAAVDGSVVPRGTWHQVTLREGQRVELLTAVQGG
jgi:sulfur carrier protein